MRRLYAFAVLTAFAALGTPIRAQDTRDSVMVQVQLVPAKAVVMERVLEAMTKEGVVVTHATPAGTVTGQYIDGSTTITVFATIFTTVTGQTTVSLAANATLRANLLGTPHLSDLVTSSSPRQGKAAWARLHRIADSVRGS